MDDRLLKIEVKELLRAIEESCLPERLHSRKVHLFKCFVALCDALIEAQTEFLFNCELKM
jgi:hypothetical protein